MKSIKITLSLLIVAAFSVNQVQAQNCSGGCNPVVWPATGDPVWEFCWVTPGASSGADGSGIEIKNVKYKGKEVMKWGHTPMLNVDYDAGGCGCYRDWADAEVRFEADGVVNACYAESSSTTTLCDITGGQGDVGSFTGVAFEDFGDSISLTTQMSAGWYRYHQSWTFHDDGRIKPDFGFATVNSTCTSAGHRHHVYWRFDFDIDGAANDYVVESSDAAADMTFTTEDSRDWGTSGNPNNVHWSVYDNQSALGYQLLPSEDDAKLEADSFSKNDFMVSRYNATELGDNSVGCAINPGDIVDGENVDGQDVVVYYRGGHYHPPGNTADCFGVGPELVPVGNWNQPNFAKLKFFLKGPYEMGGSMTTTLSDDSHMPLAQPYNMAPWNYAGTETLASLPSGAVDWVLVQLRSGTAALTEEATIAAVLMSDGSLQSVDGEEGADFTGLVAPGDYHVVVYHRNHLAVMTAAPVSVGPISSDYDLTSAMTQAYGSNGLIELELGTYGAAGGDGNMDGSVTAFDFVNAWLPNNGQPGGYKVADFNMDGEYTSFDFLLVWLASNGSSTQVPN